MSEESVGKDLGVRPAAEMVKGSKPTLIQVGRGWICSTGRVHPSLAAQYIKDKPRASWVKVGELARVFTGSNTIPGKKRVRKQMPAIFRRLLHLNEFLLYSTSKHGRIESVKCLDPTSPVERDEALPQVERMKHRHELSAEKYEQAVRVLTIFDQLNECSPPS